MLSIKTKYFGLFNKISLESVSIDSSLKNKLPGLLKYCDTSKVTKHALLSLSYPRTVLTRFSLVDMLNSLSDDDVVQIIDSDIQLIKLCPGDIISRLRSAPPS